MNMEVHTPGNVEDFVTSHVLPFSVSTFDLYSIQKTNLAGGVDNDLR